MEIHLKRSGRSGCLGILAAAVILAALSSASGESSAYLDNQRLGGQLLELAGKFPGRVQFREAAQSLGSNSVWLLELGQGTAQERLQKPALLVVAGIEGNDLLGTSLVMSWASQLLSSKEDAFTGLLQTTTVYLFPRVNPDAADSFFARPWNEITVNRRPVDDDHDGLVDEDEVEDLDHDGLITGMRVQDPEGEYRLDPADPRLLLKADKARGEFGGWRLFSEGIDNDHDEQWNEDGRGGVNLNRNFPYNYQFFGANSGPHPVSEAETKVLVDFVVAHPNIGIVFTFGAADNLLASPPGGPSPAPTNTAATPSSTGSARQRPAAPDPSHRQTPTSLQGGDIPYVREMGRQFRETLGIKSELKAVSEPGTFSDWVYFHRGRLSLAARPWSPALQLEMVKAKTAAEEAAKAKESGKENKPAPGGKPAETAAKGGPAAKPEPGAKDNEDKRNEEDRAFLKWLDKNTPGAFVAWKSFEHPDFPGKKVELGGFAPFAKTTPPEPLVQELSAKYSRFLNQLVRQFPRLAVRQVKVKPLGSAVYDVTLQVENPGYLPTSLAQGQTTREVLPTRLVLELENRSILSGSRITYLTPIEGSGGMAEARWILYLPDAKPVPYQIVSALAGTVKGAISLETK